MQMEWDLKMIPFRSFGSNSRIEFWINLIFFTNLFMGVRDDILRSKAEGFAEGFLMEAAHSTRVECLFAWNFLLAYRIYG